jgi:aminobenzoyl-glutamate utilization protein B
MPTWTEADQTLAKAVQKEVSAEKQEGLDTKVDPLEGPVPDSLNRGGGSDDIGDVSWVAPTITLRYPSNIPGLPGHNWADAISMATPIAHKGATAGAKATAMTVIDVLTKPTLVRAARVYFDSVQTKTQKYEPLIRPDDRPATELNTEILAKYREQMKKYYYDASKPGTYLEQLGVTYPTMRTGDSCPRPTTSSAVP